MDKKTSLNWHLICAWCGPIFLVMFITFWGYIGHNLPPAGPNLSPQDIADHYADHRGMIRLGFVVAAIMITFYMPWSAVLAARLARLEGGMPALAFLQLIGGALTVMVVSMSELFWIVAAFRPGQDPNLTQLLHDLGWLTIDQLYACTTWQMVAAAVVGLCDRSDRPMLPRWACYYAIWAGLTFLPASLTAYLKVGPFAWNGVLSYYFPYFAWLSWFTIFSFFLIRDIGRERSIHATNISPITNRAGEARAPGNHATGAAAA